MSDRVYCPTCRNTVAKNYPHSCFDFATVIAVQDAKRKVVEAAERYEEKCREITTSPCWTLPMMQEKDDAELALINAFRALRAVREGR